MRPDVSYTPYNIFSRKNGDIITFAQFEEGNFLFETWNLLSETCDDKESGDKNDENSTMSPLSSGE